MVQTVTPSVHTMTSIATENSQHDSTSTKKEADNSIWSVLPVEPESLKKGDYAPIVFFVQPLTPVRQVAPSAPPPPPLVTLTDVVRKYTGGRLSTLARPLTTSQQHEHHDAAGDATKTIKPSTVLIVEMNQLYDILGMLRSLQYDIDLYNSSVVATHHDISHANNNKETDPDSPTSVLPTTSQSSQHIRYCRYRYERQVMACRNTNTPYSSTNSSSNTDTSTMNDGTVQVDGLKSLIDFIENSFQDRIQTAREHYLQQNLIDFDALAEYCRPGTILLDTGLLSGVATIPTAVRCRACRYRRQKTAMGNIVSTFEVAVEFVVAVGGSGTSSANSGMEAVDINGQYYAVIEAQWLQSEFEGTRSTLWTTANTGESSSAILLQPTKEVLARLDQRGRDYQSYCFPIPSSASSSMLPSLGSGILVDYQSETFWPCRSGPSSASGGGSTVNIRPLRMGGRMMVDPVEAWTRGVHPCKPPADGMAADAILDTLQSFARYRRQQQQQQQVQQSKTTASTSSMAPAASNAQSTGPDDILLLSGPLPDSLVAMTWPVVCGFSLVGRVWGVALVEGLSKVQFQSKAFDSLVLPAPRKRLLKALVTSHHGIAPSPSVQSTTSADVLPGKGEGLIILLHGPPGVGKTLTAEAVSEVLQRPLYRVSMGELGTTPERLEERLQEIFELCLPWKALVLIDEAEMLLESRKHSTDLVRNAMVCVMLRLLEYYPGILFLTTNSGLDDLDPAVASRITCALHYDSLDLDGRKEIWRASISRVVASFAGVVSLINTGVDDVNLLNRTTIPPIFSEVDLTELATVYANANGRQIKNAVQLASIVCRHENVPLTVETLRETMDLTANWKAPL